MNNPDTSGIRKLHHDEIARTSLQDIDAKRRHPLVVVVDNVRSLYNVGSIFRTCDGALVEKLFLTGFTPFPPRKEISKTALDADASVPWEHVYDITEVLARLREQEYSIAALEHTTGSRSCFDISADLFPLAVVVGNEVTGVSENVLPYCDLALEIPMFGIKQSLNVAVATGVLCFECVRVLQKKPATDR